MVKSDLAAFSKMNADPQVMEFFPRPWSFEESRAALEKIEVGFAERGFGTYALVYDEEFAGIVGLSVATFEASFTPCVEILWRLLPRFWGRDKPTARFGDRIPIPRDTAPAKACRARQQPGGRHRQQPGDGNNPTTTRWSQPGHAGSR